MNDPTPDRAAKWLVGDKLAAVLHLGDAPLTHELADQGHDVVVATQRPVARRHPEIEYVEVASGSFPFVADAFTVVVTSTHQTPSSVAEIARVLTPDGLVSSLTRGFDEAIPWLRKLREIVGGRVEASPGVDTVAASGLFAETEVLETAEWEKLDLDGLMDLAHRTAEVTDERAMREARTLFESYGATHQPLRLRRHTRCVRSRVLKENLPTAPEPPATTLFDLR